jgi:flagellar motility protein MotE (MotC chaperone)
MTVPARKFAEDDFMQERTALEERVDHMQRDITELKADFRRLDAKVDAVKDDLTAHRIETRDAIATLRLDLKVGRWVDRVWWLLMSAALLGVMAGLSGRT